MLKHMLDQVGLDRAFAALANPTRRDLVDRLVRGPAAIGELAGPFDMTLAGVLEHVKVLEAAGIVVTAKQGRRRVCRLDTAVLRELESWIAHRRTARERQQDRLDDVLTDPARSGATPPPPARRPQRQEQP